MIIKSGGGIFVKAINVRSLPNCKERYLSKMLSFYYKKTAFHSGVSLHFQATNRSYGFNGETFFKANENDLQEIFEMRNDRIAILALKFYKQ